MQNKSLNTFSLLLGLCFIFLINSNTVNATSDLDKIREKYNLVEISKDEIPEGVVPINLDNEEEVEKYFEEQNESLKNSIENTNNVQLDNLRSNMVTMANTGVRTTEVAMRASLPIAMKLNLLVNFDYYSRGSFTAIEKINFSRMSLTGYTISNSLTNTTTSHKRYNDGTIFVSGYGDFNTYIILENTFNLNTSTIVMKYNYALGKGFTNMVATRDGKNILK